MTPGPDGHAAEPTLLHAFGYTIGITSVLELYGECDCTTRGALREILREALDCRPEALVIDLSRLAFCDAGCSKELLTLAQLPYVSVAGARGVTALALALLESTPSEAVDSAAPSRAQNRHQHP